MSFNDFEHSSKHPEKKRKTLEDIFKQEAKSFMKEEFNKGLIAMKFLKEIISNMDRSEKQIGDRVVLFNPGGVFNDKDEPVMINKETSDVRFEDEYIVINNDLGKEIEIDGIDVVIALDVELFCTRNKRKYYCNHIDLKLIKKDAES